MSDPRYRVIVAMLDDPLNVLAVTRELLRRGKIRMLPPPVPVKKDGVKFGWLFPTLRHVMWNGVPTEYSPRAIQNVDAEVQVFTDGDHWFITLLAADNAEVGPFDSSQTAMKEARKWLENEGYVLMDSLPWDEEDARKYPIKAP